MHLSIALPLSLLSLLCVSPVLADQEPLLDLTFNDASISQAPITIIDVLSESPKHQLLMRLLQRTKLIPLLNMLNNTAFFAPDDDAITKQIEESGSTLWDEMLRDADEGSGGGRDNIQYELRQHILYHLVPLREFNASSQPRPPLAFPADSPAAHLTLYYPGKPIQPPSPNPPPGSPWLPEPGGVLAKQAQRLRVSEKDGVKSTAVNWNGEGGIAVTALSEATNGEVWSVDTIIPLPPTLGESFPFFFG